MTAVIGQPIDCSREARFGTARQPAAIASETTSAGISIDRVSMVFPGTGNTPGAIALDDVSFEAASGQFCVLLGPSGCGKSTLLQMVAGLARPTSGTVSVDGQEVNGPGMDRTLVFQEYGLFPWLNVVENVMFGLANKQISKEASRCIAQQWIEVVHLEGSEEKYPHQLSGGMRQRVAIARALAVEPKTLLMDEPFVALDQFTRISLQKQIAEVWAMTHKTILFVTHNIDEALLLGDRVIAFTPSPGRVQSILDLPWERPRTQQDLINKREYIDIKRDLIEMFETPAEYQ